MQFTRDPVINDSLAYGIGSAVVLSVWNLLEYLIGLHDEESVKKIFFFNFFFFFVIIFVVLLL